MERIWIAGSSGSGKTTLANIIGDKLHIPVYHRDYITWDRSSNIVHTEGEQIAITKEFTQNERWIFDGARFTASRTDGRLERCDTIIHLDLNRFICLFRTIKRGHRKAKINNTSELDKQPFHAELFNYILLEYPGKHKQREELFELARTKGINVITLKNQNDVNSFVESI